MEESSAAAKPKVTLTEATEKDVKKLVAIETAGSTGEMHAPLLREEKWVQYLGTHTVWLIRVARKVVGYLAVQHKSAEHVRVHGVVVLPEQRGVGVESAVLGKFVEEMQAVPRIDLAVHPLHASMQVFKSVGFTEESLHENFYGDGEPRIVMVYE